ncbi:MAG: exodeoxyribonuclease VII large subunit [Bacteroidaceae bacterium]|nr:exodeoxyribonuclease VII large subunit [Bacteroidaceae bacterium]
MKKALTLYELNGLVRETLELTLDDEYWVQAEISELRVNRHCYMELVQKEQHGNGIVAKARAQVWANRWAFIKPMFEQMTRQTLAAGMQVQMKVEVTFHELYGYSLNVTDIDPTYTMGDIARRRQEILQQLVEEGIDTMNRELPLPRLLQRIAVISSATAAGYGDFCNQLNSNKRGLAFKTELFAATMQGNDVERSVIDALNRIAEQIEEWDVVVIIRGGGATSDLQGFDSLLLAENVAQFHLPIITGIGHERDDTVIDMIAHTRVKTPTAAAEFLIHHQEEELNWLEELAARLTDNIDNLLLTETARLKLLANKLPMLFSTVKAREEIRLNRLSAALANNSIQSLSTAKERVHLLGQQLRLYAPALLRNEEKHIELIESKLRSAHPDRILRLGFSIARIDGKAIRDASEVKEGDEIETTLATGSIRSIIRTTNNGK